MHTIVTHINPDLDALSSVWLIRRYLPDFQGDDVNFEFVPAGKTRGNADADTDPDVVHVDTGRGRFDHHQIPEKICAFLQVYKHLVKENLLPAYDIDPLKRMCEVINAYDNFQEVYFPDVTADYQLFQLESIIGGLVHAGLSDTKKVEVTLPIFDGLLQIFKNKLKAEKNVTEGVIFETKAFGKSILMENSNNESMKYAQKLGYVLVARKDPKQGNIRILCLPDDKLDLTPIYEAILKKDTVGTWFLHQSKHMLLNGSIVNPSMKASPLTTDDIMSILKNF